MIRKSDLRAAFEREVRVKMRGLFGFKRSCTYDIRIYGSKTFFVALRALPLGFAPFVVARSYPMSYKSAHQLVCSL